MDGMEVVGRSSDDLNKSKPTCSGTCPPGGDPHGGYGGGWPPCYGGGWPLGCPGYGCTGGRQKPGPQVDQNPIEGGGS
jgi:hypothetical protein